MLIMHDGIFIWHNSCFLNPKEILFIFQKEFLSTTIKQLTSSSIPIVYTYKARKTTDEYKYMYRLYYD